MGAWETPAGPRGVLCVPPLSEWSSLADANRRAAAAWDFDILGVPATALRTRARRTVRRFVGADDISGTGGVSGAGTMGTTDGGEAYAPLFVTGHQPQFYHPGVWMKAFATKAAARSAGGVGVNWVVDHDTGELAVTVPRRDGDEVRAIVHRLVSGGTGRPFETLPGPTRQQAEAFIAAVDADVASLGLDETLDLWRTFADGLSRLVAEPRGRSSGEVMSAAEIGYESRAAYERALGCELIPDVPLSRVCETEEFLLFFIHWIAHAERLRDVYNGALARFREGHGVRSRAHPFPDLLVRPDGGIELPFWGLTTTGVRRKLYVREEAGRLVLSHLEGEFASIPVSDAARRNGGRGEASAEGHRLEADEAIAALVESGVHVRPRALPLTVFSRLFVADVFVHGTGGARYDEVTDDFIEGAFGVRAPRFATVSATMHLPLQQLPVQPSALKALEYKLRDLRFNPQRHAWEVIGADGASDERIAALVREKERLIDEIRRMSPGRRSADGDGKAAGKGEFSPKRILTRAIESTNSALYSLLTDVERDTEERLEALRRRARSSAVATRRTYPFFLYDPAHMKALLENGGV